MEKYIEKETINEPKTKSINYNFQNMKFFLYSWVIGMEGVSLYKQKGGYCTEEGYAYMQMVYHSSYIMLIINTLFLVYAYIRLRFVRFSFYLNFVVNVIYNLTMIIMSINLASSQPQECLPVIMVQKSIIFLTIKKEIEIWTVLKMPLDMASRQANLSSNFLFPYLLLSSGDLDQCSKKSQRIRFLMLFGHSLVSVFGTVMNCLLHYLQTKHKMKLRGGFKFTIIICTICMIFIYIMIIEYDGPQAINTKMECFPLLYTLTIYPRINVLSIFSMILLYFFEDEDLINRIKNFLFDSYEQLTSKDNNNQQDDIIKVENSSFMSMESQPQPKQNKMKNQYYETELNINQQGISKNMFTYQDQDNPDKFQIPKGILSAKDQIPYLKTFVTEVVGSFNFEQENILQHKQYMKNTFGTLFDSPYRSNKLNQNQFQQTPHQLNHK